jgi:uncharacterized repeat protein (TIGR02543 family)
MMAIIGRVAAKEAFRMRTSGIGDQSGAISTKMIALAAVIVLIAGGIGAYALMNGNGDGKDDGKNGGNNPATPASYTKGSALSWSYWLGNLDSPGVSDALTPTSLEGMTEVWRSEAVIDGSSANWKVPGSAICVGSHTYFYRGSDSTLNCVVTATGENVKSVICPSDAVYNMAIAYGDGKVFVPCSTDSATVMRAFDATTLEQLFVSSPVSGGEVQGPIVYHEGKVFFGTYSGDFACFSSADVNTAKSDEVASPLWLVTGDGWYNAVPAFFGTCCVVIEKGYTSGGSNVYSVDVATGAIVDTMSYNMEYGTSGAVAYNGRVYLALNAVTDKSVIEADANTGKTMTIRSYVVLPDGTFDRSTEEVWASSVVNGGTQSTPVIWNDRLYIAGGGSTLGSNEPFTVITIASDGTMATAYTVDSLLSKGTAAISCAYATPDNGYKVYIYMLEYGHVKDGESANSYIGSADIFVLSDCQGQTSAKVEFRFTPSVQQFAYQSFSISPDGYVLVRNDSTLFCYGPSTPAASTADGLMSEITRAVAMSAFCGVTAADAVRIEERYASLSDTDKEKVTNYNDLEDLYCKITLKVGAQSTETKVLKGSVVDVSGIAVPNGYSVMGWKNGADTWRVYSDRVTADTVLQAVLAETSQVNFDSDGGSAVLPIAVASGKIMGYVAEPVRSGYVFAGWYHGAVQYLPQKSTVTGDITLKASWLQCCVITFDSDGGSSADAITAVNTRAVGELPTIRRSGYTFEGWYIGDKQVTSATVCDFGASAVLKAKWTENASITVSSSGGIKVTGQLPNDATVSVVKASSVTSSYRAIKTAAGTAVDCLVISLSGDGIDDSQNYMLSLPVGTASNGSTLTVYCYVSGTVTQVSGVVSDGMLTVAIAWTVSTSGVQATIGLAQGTEIASHV